MKKWIYIIAVLLFSLPLCAKAQEKRKNELLTQLTKTPNDTTRLKVLSELTEATKYNPLIRIYYIDQLLKEAERQDNDFYKCKAYLHRVYVAFNQRDKHTLHHWHSLLKPLATKNHYYDMMFKGWCCVADLLHFSGEYEKEERESLIMLKEAEKVDSEIGKAIAYQSLGFAYVSTYRNQNAFNAFVKAYHHTISLNDPALTLDILTAVINLAGEMKDKENWLKYTCLEEKCIKDSQKNGTANYSLHESLFMMYVHYASLYLTENDLEKAGKYYQLAKSSYYESAQLNFYKEYYMYISCAYLTKIEQYENALLHSDTLLHTFREVSSLDYNIALDERGKILYAMGRNEEAVRCFKTAKAGSDSAQLQILTKQAEQVKHMHQVNVLQKEKEHKVYSQQLFLLSFLIVSILIIIGFLIHTYLTRRKLKLDESEMRKMTKEVELANLAKERFLSNISCSIAEPLDKVVESSLFLSSGEELDDEKRNKLSDIINKTSAQLMRLINDILDLSRLEAGMMNFALSDVELYSLIHDIAAGISIDKNKTIEVECPQEALFWLHIDGNRLVTLFQHLFTSSLSSDKIRVIAEPNTANSEVWVKVYNTELAKHNLSQELIIQNEINRMIVTHFDGSYEVYPDAPVPYIHLTLKGNSTSNS